MWKKVAQFSLVVLASITLASSAVFAQQEEQIMQTQAIETEDESEAPEETRADRVERYKERRQEALTNAKTSRIRGRCTAAQGKIKSQQARVKAVSEGRMKVYDTVMKRPSTLSPKLEAAGADVSELLTLQIDIENEITSVKTSLEEYETTLADLGELDCEADPEAFYSALEAARAELIELRTNSASIKSLIQTNLRTTLQEIRAQLKTNDEAETEPTEDETTNETVEQEGE